MKELLYRDIRRTLVLIRGAGEMATGVAHRLFKSGFSVCLIETSKPLAVRRKVAYSEAVYDGQQTVEEVTALRISDPGQIDSVWATNKIPLLVDPKNETKDVLLPHVVVDAILAKKNLGTRRTDAPLVIGLGPGFSAPTDVHVVIETNRGHNLGRLILTGTAEANTGIPGAIAGYAGERVFRAPCSGVFETVKAIGDSVSEGEVVARVEGAPIRAKIRGIIRGLLRNGTAVTKGLKAGDIDPRGNQAYCDTISEKARALGGSVLEAILSELPGRTAG